MSAENINWIERVTLNLESRNQAIEAIYHNEALRSKIHNYILSNRGDEQLAEEAFSEAIIVFVKQCFKPHFTLKSNIEAYIFTVARNYFIKQIKTNKVDLMELPESYGDKSISDSEDQHLEKERLIALDTALTQIDEKCKKVLTMWASSHKMREIALRMDYKSEGFARKKKHKCLEKLKKLIKKI